MTKRHIPKFKLPPLKPEKQSIVNDIKYGISEIPSGAPMDNARLSPDLDFIIEQKKERELERKLEKGRIHADEARARMNIEWKIVEHNEYIFQRTIMVHNRFVKKNLEKRERALAKIQIDNELIKKREKNIRALKEKYRFFNTVLNDIKTQIKAHNIYEDYLSAVMSKPESPFKNVQEILSKYEIMEHVKEHCVKKQKEELTHTVILHDENIELFRLQGIVLIGLRNELNNLRCKYEEICRRNLTTESLITSIVERTNNLKFEISSVQYMIDHLYSYICQRKKMAHGEHALNDITQKVDTLKETLHVWKQILEKQEIIKMQRTSITYPNTVNSRKKSSFGPGMFMWKKKTSVGALMAAMGWG